MCQLTRGFAIDCSDAVSGIKNLYVANYSKIGTPTQNATGQITAFTGATGTPFFKYELRDQAGDWNSVPTVNESNGTSFFVNTVNFMLSKSEQSKRNEIKLLSRAGATIIAEGWDGKFWVIGYKNSAKWGGGQMGVARNWGDLNGFEVTLVANETDMPAEIAYSAFSSLVTANS
jgi:hypothetical protein